MSETNWKVKKMRDRKKPLALLAAAGLATLIGTTTRAEQMMTHGRHDAYVQTNLVWDGMNGPKAKTPDANLKNSWGIAFFPGSAFWIADNNMGVSSLYDGAGNVNPLVVQIPPPAGSPPNTLAAPTGIIANTTLVKFVIPNVTPTGQSAFFIFDTEDGTISGWNPAVDKTHAQLIVDNSASGCTDGSVYKGLAMGANASGVFLYATNFRCGTIDVFDSTFKSPTLTGNFSDPKVPAGYAPFGIANIRGNLFVTFAQQNAAKHDDVSGPGHGFVDIFDTDGHLIRQFAERGHLDSPWGIAEAPFNFGRFSGDILIGNFGDGTINVYDPRTGEFEDQLEDPDGEPITIDGLWALTFGGATGSNPGTLYFTAGPDGEVDGLFGSIAPQ
jgi:uncharacterized protein (TIGR03118 family)